MATTKTPARKSAATPARQAKASDLTLILASDKVRENQADKVSSLVATLGFNDEATARSEGDLVVEMERYRRMFPAKPGGASDILGTDQPDLIGASEAYKLAWTKVMNAARDKLSQRLQEVYGLGEDAANITAKTRVETDRKNVSVRYRNRLEAQVRSEIANPVERARFMLAHGFKYSTTVTGDAPCIGGKDWTLNKEGALVVPGHEVNAAKGEIKALPPKPETAANQQGKGKESQDTATAAQKVANQVVTAYVSGSPLPLVREAAGLLGTAIGINIPEGTALTDLADAYVVLERMALKLREQWGITSEAHAAARARSGGASAAKVAEAAVKAAEKAPATK